jgi:hypothetical protein
MFSRQLCSNPHCKRTSPGDGPTCRWHVRNYGSQKDPKHVTLCNACKINFDQGKYCPFCVQIYREKDPDSFDGKEWVGCDNRTCRRWVHVECEIGGGNQVDSTAFYLCPSCRENAQEFGDRKRCGRLPAQEQPVVSSCQAQMDSSSSDHEQKPKMPLSLRSTRRPLQVDLSKLEVRAFLFNFIECVYSKHCRFSVYVVPTLFLIVPRCAYSSTDIIIEEVQTGL